MAFDGAAWVARTEDETRAAPGVEEILSHELKELSDARMALSNAVGSDDIFEAWEEVMVAAGRMEDASEALLTRVRDAYNERDAALDAEEDGEAA